MNSVLRSFEAQYVYYHFIHQQCFLLVTKDSHNLLFASQCFSTTSFSHFCCSNFLNSVLRCSETYIAFYHFIHQQCCLLVTKVGHNVIFASQFFCCHLSDNSLIATSWILFYYALKRLMLFTTLFINSVVCWSPKLVIMLSSRRNFFAVIFLTIRF